MQSGREARAVHPPGAVWRLNSSGGCESPEERGPTLGDALGSEGKQAALR
jgi:hypothetical protein